MNIKDVADVSQRPAKTNRYYEDIGLLVPSRAANGYRRYTQRDLHQLVFIGRARSLGFTSQDCRTPLALYDDKGRASVDVKPVAQEHLGRIEQKISELQAMRRTLKDLISSCRGNHRPDCPILDDLASERVMESPAA